jgi:hypothetical protein
MMNQHKLIVEIEKLKWNRDKVKFWIDNNLSPRWGLSAELTQYMYKLYEDVSGDYQFSNKLNCGACQNGIWQRLNDFNNYGNNIGKPLINWEPIKKKKKDENRADDTTKLE